MVAVLAGGCARPVEASLSWRIGFECGADAEYTESVLVRIVEGECPGFPAPVYEAVVKPGATLDAAPKRLPAGRYAFRGEATDIDGAQVASGCVVVDLPATRPIELTLTSGDGCGISDDGDWEDWDGGPGLDWDATTPTDASTLDGGGDDAEAPPVPEPTVELSKALFLSWEPVAAQFEDVANVGSPMLGLYPHGSPVALETFAIPFEPGQSLASGSHEFAPVPAGAYEVRLVADRKILMELSLEVVTDTDEDGTADGDDACPEDPNKISLGACGCGVPEGTCEPTPCASQLLTSEALQAGVQRCSENREYQLRMTADGDLVLSKGNVLLWSAGTCCGADNHAKMQADGNLVVYNGSGTALWSSKTADKAGATLTVENNGSAVIRQSGVVVWSVGPFADDGKACVVTPEGGRAQLQCAFGKTITSIDFASYGTPNGTCGSFTTSGCHAASSQTTVEATCLGQASCTVQARNATFGDPCSGAAKRLAIAYTCTAAAAP